ncbi:WD repeat-containing protein 38 [Irineochytrium annulatum]|nr:WD repeat-containing protein 38 [Irineochytrium annulatum]
MEGADWVTIFNTRSTVLNSVSGLARPVMELLHSFELGAVVCCIRFSSDGRLLATGSRRKAQVFDVGTGACLHILELVDLEHQAAGDPPGPDLYVRSVCFSPDARLLATGAEDHVVRIFDLTSEPAEKLPGAGAGSPLMHRHVRPKMVLKGHGQDIYSLDWARDGRWVVSGSGDRSVKVWDSDSGRLVLSLDNEADRVETIQGSGATGDPAREAGVTSVAVNPKDGLSVVTGSLDHVIRLWDLRTGRLLERFLGHMDSVYSVAFTPDGRSIVSGSLDRTLKLWDLSQQTLSILAHPPLPPPGPNVNPNHYYGMPSTGATCRHTFAGHRDYVLSVGSAIGGQGRGWIDVVGQHHQQVEQALADVEWVVSSSKDRTVMMWDGRGVGPGPGTNSADLKRSAILMLQGHKNSVIAIALAAQGGIFATGSGDMKVRIWRVSMTLEGDSPQQGHPQQQHQSSEEGARENGMKE